MRGAEGRVDGSWAMKLTLRDLFWLMLLVGAVTAWWVEQVGAARASWQRYRHVIGSEHNHPNFHKRELRRRAALDEFAQMTDEELNEYFGSLPASKYFLVGDSHYDLFDEYEPCLDEMSRRGMSKQLQKHYDALIAQSVGKTGFDFPENLELLTALRRAQGMPDPFVIHLKYDGGPSVLSQFGEPRFSATIENVDSGLEAASLKRGGDYRGGRLDRWRFVLTDEKGRVVVDSLASLGGGGLYQALPLHYGEKSEMKNAFDLRSYLAPPPSGEYRLQAIYHNRETIAGQRDVDGLIVTRSEPMAVIIRSQPRMNGVPRWIDIPLPLAVLVGCVVVTLAAIGRSESGFMGITRRDFRWGLMMVALAMGMWLSDGWPMGSQKYRHRQYDFGDWSIRTAEGNRLGKP
jgi:hypothetical protein